MRFFIRYWLPVILWVSAILIGSGPALSAQHTGSILSRIIAAIVGHPVSDADIYTLHVSIRKCGHLFEYAVLSLLTLRALRGDRRGSDQHRDGRLIAVAIAFCVVTASIDEWRQTFVPGRTGTPRDVAVDAIGAGIAQGALWLWNRRR